MITLPRGRGNFFSNHQKDKTIFRNVSQREFRHHFVDSIACFREWGQPAICDSQLAATDLKSLTATWAANLYFDPSRPVQS